MTINSLPTSLSIYVSFLTNQFAKTITRVTKRESDTLPTGVQFEFIDSKALITFSDHEGKTTYAGSILLADLDIYIANPRKHFWRVMDELYNSYVAEYTKVIEVVEAPVEAPVEVSSVIEPMPLLLPFKPTEAASAVSTAIIEQVQAQQEETPMMPPVALSEDEIKDTTPVAAKLDFNLAIKIAADIHSTYKVEAKVNPSKGVIVISGDNAEKAVQEMPKRLQSPKAKAWVLMTRETYMTTFQ